MAANTSADFHDGVQDSSGGLAMNSGDMGDGLVFRQDGIQRP